MQGEVVENGKLVCCFFDRKKQGEILTKWRKDSLVFCPRHCRVSDFFSQAYEMILEGVICWSAIGLWQGNGEEWCARQGRVWSVHALLLQYIALVFQNDRKFPSLKPAMWQCNSMVHRGKVVLNCTARCGFWRFGQNPWKNSRGPSLNECGLQVLLELWSLASFNWISKDS